MDPKWVRSIGAIGIGPEHLAIWIAVDKDWERDQLREDATFKRGCIDALGRCGYPPEALPFVGIQIESQQTVESKSGGSWHIAMQ